MPNFFNNLENETKNQHNNQHDAQNFWNEQQEVQNKVESTRLENKNRYGVDISDEEYACYNNLIANSKNPDEEAHKIGTAILFSKNLGITRDEAYANLDQYKKAYWDEDKTTNYRKWYKAAADSFKMGANNVRVGMLGMELMSAQKDGNKERVDALLNEYNALTKDNENRYDNAPRSWVTNCIKDGMQSLPYSLAAGGAAMFGSFILPGVGTAMSFGLSSTLMAGQEYIDALNEGVRPEIARSKALISGALQGAVESALDPIVGATTGTIGKVTGRVAITKPTEQLIEKLTTSLQRKFHFGKAGKIAVNSIFEYLKSLPSEGAEEFIQQEIGENIQNQLFKKENEERANERSRMLELAVNQIGDAVKEDLEKTIISEYPDLEIKNQKEILNNSIEAFKGGIRGAIVLGLIPGAAKGIATEIDYLKIKELATTIESEKMFTETVEATQSGENVKNEFTSKQQETLWHDIWTDAQKQRELNLNNKAKEIAEVNPANEGYEIKDVDEETGELIVEEPYRKENGELETANVKTGENTYSFRVGDSTKKENNLYGNIEYSKDEQNKVININAFEMSEQREGLRNELFNDFAKANAGYEIKWENVIGERAKQARQSLINANPRGKGNGLNYYENEISIKNNQAIKEVTGKIKNIFESHNKTISDEELTHFAAFTQMAYNSLAEKQMTELNNAGIDSYADFINSIEWRNSKDLKKALSDNEKLFANRIQGKTIQADMQEIAKGAKAIIYVGQNGNFTTLIHEFTHFLRGIYTDEAIKDVAEALGVKKENGKYNWTDKDEEKLAYNFEQYLSGKYATDNNGLKSFFDHLAKFMVGAITHMRNFITLTPQIIEAYDNLLKGDNSVLKAASDAVNEMERGRKAKAELELQREQFKHQQEKVHEERIKDARKETVTKAEEQALNEDFPLNEEEKEEASKKVKQEEKLVNDVKNNLSKSSLSEKEKEVIANFITNPDISMEEKQDLSDEVSVNAYNDEEGLYQLMDLDSVKEVARNGYATDILYNAKVFLLQNAENSDFRRHRKDYSESQIQEELKRQTGWEMINGKPRYELDDSFNHLKGTEIFNLLVKKTPAGLSFYSDNKNLKMDVLVEANELYKYFPLLRNARLQFYITSNTDASIFEITNEGIAINLATIDLSTNQKAVNGIMGILTRAFQNFIFASEYARDDKYKKNSYSDIYKEIKKTAQKLNIDTAFTEEATVKANELNENTLQMLSLQAAKRLQKSTSEKSKTSFNTVDEVKDSLNNKTYGKKALYQLMGTLGATPQDAIDEANIRIEKYKFAKEMESKGNNPSEIVKSTGWERNNNYLWQYVGGEVANKNFKPKKNLSVKELSKLFKRELDITLEDQTALLEASYMATLPDFTQDFNDVENGNITATDIENHLDSILNQAFNTSNSPLQIEIVSGNKAHVISGNVQFNERQFRRHQTALINVEQLINNSKKNNRNGTVDLTHNFGKTLAHKKNDVIEYVYFDSDFVANNELFTVELQAERIKNQDPSLLDLYHVHVKKGTLSSTNLIAFRPSPIANNLNKNKKNVKQIGLNQTQDELYEDARRFDTWQEFMDDYIMDFNPVALEAPNYHDQVPSDADAQFYQSVWEMAHAMQTEESMNEQEVIKQQETESTEAASLDAFFVTKMTNDPDMLDNFLMKAAEIDNIDFGSEDYVNPADEEEELQWQKMEAMQDYIRTQLSHGSWISNGKRLLNGKQITDSQRQRIVSLIKAAPRDYRAVYAEIMEAPFLKVEYKDSVAAKLEKNARKYKLVNPNDDIERLSPEKRRQLAEQINDREVKEKIRSGKMKLDNEVTAYIKSLEKQAKNAKKEVEDLEAAQASDYKTIADWETRRLLELNKKLIEAKAEYEKSNDKITREIAKGIKISDKYKKQVQNLKGNYDEIFRKFEDLRSVITINAKVQEMLDRQAKIKKAKGKVGKIEDEAEVMRQVKVLRIQLVKRTMRRVPFDRIAYDQAKTIIAIQRMLEPNLLGGVNRWISTEGAILRNVISGILTDEDYKNQIMAFVKANRKSSEASNNFIQKLSELKSIEDYEKWDEKTKKYAIKHLPKEDWIRELNLKELAKERELSIDLDIETVEEQTPLKNENGEVVYQPFYEADGVTIVKDPKDPKRIVKDANGKIKKDESGATIYLPVYDNTGVEVDPEIKRPYTLTTFKLKAPEDIKKLVKDNVGADMYDAIVNRPFADWSTEDLEKLAIRINNLYKDGRDKLAATKQLRREGQQELRNLIENAAKNTGITINPDDPEDVKKKKQEKINKILGLDNAIKGTKNLKKESKINRLLHGYADANVRRVARILDNYSEGVNTDLLYWREDECYNNKQRSITNRVNNINQVLKDFNINLNDLYKEVEVQGRKFTVDELLFFLAADEDFIENEELVSQGYKGLAANDDYAPTSRNAVMFGNMLSDKESLELKEKLEQEDKDMAQRIESGELTTDERNALILNELVKKPGTKTYIEMCKSRYEAVLNVAREIENTNQGFKALRNVIAQDYFKQYDRMNEVSISEFNTPVNRVKCYVPLYRLESNGDTNENQVRADLLATMGADSTRSWVNKGMTKRRTEISPIHQKPVQTGLYKTWAESSEKTEHFIAYSGYVRDLNAVYKSRDANYLRQFIENRFGKGMINYVDDYIAEIANPGANKTRTAADEIVRTLRGKTAPAYLSWKASSILKQATTSPWPYMQFINPVSYITACFKCMQSGVMDSIKRKSVFMAQRRFDPMADLTDEMSDKAKNKFDSFMAKTSQIGMTGLEMIDWVCVAPGWLACYEKEYARLSKANDERYQAIKRQLEEDRAYAKSDNYMSNEEIERIAEKTLNDAIEYDAVRYADDCVRLCQPSNRSVDISPLFKNSSEAWKAYLQFQTSLNVIWQNLRYDIPYAVRQKQFKQITGMILGYTMAGIAMNFLMEGAGNGTDDDDKEKQIVKNLIYYSTTQFSDSIPLIGSAVTSANQKIITGKSGYTQSGTDMTPMLTKFLKVGENAVKGATYSKSGEDEKSKEAWIKACTNFGEGVGMYLGLPTQGVKEITKIVGIGDKDGEIGIHLENVYGSLEPVANKIHGDK